MSNEQSMSNEQVMGNEQVIVISNEQVMSNEQAVWQCGVAGGECPRRAARLVLLQFHTFLDVCVCVGVGWLDVEVFADIRAISAQLYMSSKKKSI